MFKQLRAKPVKMKKFLKHNVPKERSCGKNLHHCRRCGSSRAYIGSFGLKLCRKCFKAISRKIGFNKYS